MKSNSFWRSDSFIWGLAIFLFAFTVRVIFLRQAAAIPLFTIPIKDMDYHYKWAVAIINNSDYIKGPFFRAPLYPYFLAAVFSVFGPSILAAQLVQVVIGSLSAVFVFLIGRKVFDVRTGVVAGLFMSLYGTMIFYDGLLLIPTLAISLNLSAVLILIYALERGKPPLYLAAGIALGLSAIAIPTVLAFAVALGGWLLIRVLRKRKGISVRSLLLLAIGVILPIVPVTLHNLNASGELTAIGTYGGLNFYIGNNTQSDGVSANLPGARRDWWGMMEDAERIANQESGRTLSESEQSAFWTQKTLDEIAHEPGLFVRHLIKKTILLIEGNELSNNVDFYFFAHRSSVLRLLIWYKYLYLPFGLILPLAVVGMILAGWSKVGVRPLLLFLLTYAPAIILFFVTARYRIPLAPFLVLFAAYFVTSIPTVLKRASRKRLIAYGLTLVLMLVLCNTDVYGYRKKNDAQGYYTMASLYARMGDTSREEFYYRKTIAEDTTLSEAYNNLGLLEASKGNVPEALSLLRAATELSSENFMYQYNLGYLYLQSGHPDSAIAPLRQVVKVTPDNLYALNNLGMAYLNTNKFDSAASVFRQSIQVDSSFASAYYNLAITYQQLGQPDSAIYYFEKDLHYYPGDADALYNLGLLALERRDVGAAQDYLSRYVKATADSSGDAVGARQLLDSLGRAKNK